MSKAAQDEGAGIRVKNAKGQFVAVYDRELALEILERVAEGELLRDICAKEGMPHISTVRRWGVNNPEFGRAFQAAVQLSASTLEEEALSTARSLADPKFNKKLSGTEVRAFEVAMAQLRWSAARRDPGKYGERAPASVVVPIQINTSLDLGKKGELENIYTIEAKVQGETVVGSDGQLVPDPVKRKRGGQMKPRLQYKEPPIAFGKMVRGETSANNSDASDVAADVRATPDDPADQQVEPSSE